MIRTKRRIISHFIQTLTVSVNGSALIEEATSKTTFAMIAVDILVIIIVAVAHPLYSK